MKFNLEKIEDPVRWDDFVEASPQGTVFSLSNYLISTGRPYETWFVLSGTEVRAGVALVRSEKGDGYELDDLVIYNGPCFARPNPNQKRNGRISEQFAIQEFLIETLVPRCECLEMSLSPGVVDVRPFLWYKYHSADPREKFAVDVRYTSHLDISEFRDVEREEETRLFQEMDMKRRQSIRKARKLGVLGQICPDPESLVALYAETLAGQGKPVSESFLSRMRNVIEAGLASGIGSLFMAPRETGEHGFLAYFLHDSKRAYYLFGAGDPSTRDDYCGTVALWDCFRFLSREYGIKEVDMEGVNSPWRGWFKLSFGGTIDPYYEVRLNRRSVAKN